jgi:hypothetical protein
MIVHLLEALRWASDQPCKPSNCGTVCLCGPCSARRSLALLDPAYRPRHTKNFYWPVRLDETTKSVRNMSPEQQREFARSLGLTLDPPKKKQK